MTSHTQNTPSKVLPLVKVHIPEIIKFQLQLFPIDEPTRKSLEEERHCPYLELTITTKKKIASVIKHLNHKWVNFRSAFEELILFPYNARVESLESYERWSLKDSYITAAEVHAAIGKPAVFRLRYGWFKLLDPKMKNFSQISHNLANQSCSKKVKKKVVVDQEKQPSSSLSQECDQFPVESLLKQSVQDTSAIKSIQPADNLRIEKDAKLSWFDGVSNMSFGALFSAVEAAEGAKVCRQVSQNSISINCDSFDAAIAAHIARYQPTTMAQPSFFDAEETCKPFFSHSSTSNNNIQLQFDNSSNLTVESHRVKAYNALSPLLELAQNDGCVPLNMTLTSIDGTKRSGDENSQLTVSSQDFKHIEKEEMQTNENATNAVNNQFEGLDMHWPPSAGPWNFEVSSSQQVINNDSDGFNGLVSTSMDIF